MTRADQPVKRRADALLRIRRLARKPPRVVARRLESELRSELERLVAPRRGRRFDERTLLAKTGAADLDALWEILRLRPFPAATRPVDLVGIEEVGAGERERVRGLAERALRREVDLLGSGPVSLGRPAAWHTDLKTGASWPLGWARRIDYLTLGRSSDVKVPWEVSRMQWLLPVGQSYLLDGDERYAELARELLDDWIDGNPYGLGVNWSVTMEVALRSLTWAWLFHVFAASAAFRDRAFRSRFLRSLYLHGDWTWRNLELSDVNGNHLTADAAGLACAGLFFGGGPEPSRWAQKGWRLLLEELPRQVYRDGVDFEGSVAYHRLVSELFFVPAHYRARLGLAVPAWYRERLSAMALFSAVVTRPDGTTPLLGDHDDARVLPLGSQSLGDHRYLAGLIGAVWDDHELRASFSGPRSEVAWHCGAAAAAPLPDRASVDLPSRAFRDAGVYVMRAERCHVVVDCGPVGLAGRGGHGHNDCLSFEAWLDQVQLIVDSGCFVYSASPQWRNRLRATPAHNTPAVDGEEQNQLDPTSLWTLGYDAIPELRYWGSSAERDLLTASHSGYRRLRSPLSVVRTVALDKREPLVVVRDSFEGAGEHEVRVPFHFPPELEASEERRGRWLLHSRGRQFALEWHDPESWQGELIDSWYAPSYGVRRQSHCLELRRRGSLAPLLVSIAPGEHAADLVARSLALVEARS